MINAQIITTGLNNILYTKSKIETTHASFVFLKRRAVTSGSDALVGTQQRFRLRVVILASSTGEAPRPRQSRRMIRRRQWTSTPPLLFARSSPMMAHQRRWRAILHVSRALLVDGEARESSEHQSSTRNGLAALPAASVTSSTLTTYRAVLVLWKLNHPSACCTKRRSCT